MTEGDICCAQGVLETMLEDRLTQELRETYEELHRQEEILTRERLKSCYELFRSRFGPEVLANLDGEDLLNLMHAHGTRDSLVYWLEFKDDEEMPAHFGSIAGGSALKFGIYRNRDTGAWMTGSALSQQEITLEEAIEKARVHRNELLAGAKLLDSLAPDGTDEDYRALQDTMKTAAPTVGDTSWGHKYFSMLYPEKLLSLWHECYSAGIVVGECIRRLVNRQN
ncbi:MAG: hypothetical protein SVP26_10980, partial [Chloroflexota bacterium]|nr:hypothetical protein [Chloroflexota bacterium]